MFGPCLPLSVVVGILDAGFERLLSYEWLLALDFFGNYLGQVLCVIKFKLNILLT